MSDLPEKQETMSCSINRREFCKFAPAAVFGGMYLSSLGRICLAGEKPKSSLKGPHFQKENTMDKKIIAVEAKVISQKGTCGLGHKPGDVARFTKLGVEGKICIHALYSMMPGVFAMMFDVKFPWLEDPEKKTHACPDAYNPVVFEIKKIRE